MLGLSGWLGKIWANQFMEKERLENEKQLTEFQSTLRSQNESEIEQLKSNLEIFKEQHLTGFHDKLETYREVINITSEIVAKFQSAAETGAQLNADTILKFDNSRMKVYGYLALVSPQAVMDANDELADYVLSVINKEIKPEWTEFRDRAQVLLNEMRRDLGMGTGEIEYRGKR